jgi:CCR4-NOT transcription complex subunit 2
MWANPNIRTPSGTTPSNQNQPAPNRPAEDFETYRFNHRGNQQQNPPDEFPPLGDERRNHLLSSFNPQPGVGRLPFDQEQLIRGAADRNPTPRGRTLTNPNPFPIPENLGAIGSQSYGYLGRNGGYAENLAADMSHQEPIGPGPIRSRPVGQVAPKKRLADMNPREKHGLTGLIAKLDPEHPDYSPMIMGLDLNELGFDLNRPPSTPLYPTFGTPFGPPGQQESRPPIPDFTLPAAYNVTNVPPLHSKVPSMSDDCLMFIFYSAPRDVAQELAAQEL